MGSHFVELDAAGASPSCLTTEGSGDRLVVFEPGCGCFTVCDGLAGPVGFLTGGRVVSVCAEALEGIVSTATLGAIGIAGGAGVPAEVELSPIIERLFAGADLA